MLVAVLMAVLPLFCIGQTANSYDARYYPLALGNVWIYRVHRTASKPVDSTVEWRVKRAGNTYQVWPKPMQADDEPMELAVTREGIKEISSNTLIIKFPTKTGQTWSAGGGGGNQSRTLRVLSSKQSCSVNGLKIPDCLTIEDEDSSATGLRTVTTYGRDIGPVRYVYYRKKEGTEPLVQTVTLISHKVTGP